MRGPGAYQPVEPGQLVLLEEIDNGDSEILPFAQRHKVGADVREVGQVPREFLQGGFVARLGLRCPLACRRGAARLAPRGDETRREELAVRVVGGYAVGGGEEGLLLGTAGQ